MIRPEWFRRSTWTEQDRAEFNARLNRSRGASSKAQYLRIQAVHLAEAGHHLAAIELLDRLLAEFPEKLELASTHQQKGESLAHIGQIMPAICEYRAALQMEREYPNVRTGAWLAFGWLVVQHNLQDLYEEVSLVFQEFIDRSRLTFPMEAYRYYAVESIIADSRGNRTSAKAFATQALTEARRTNSGFRYHAKLGLVGSQPSWMEQKLRAIAAS